MEDLDLWQEQRRDWLKEFGVTEGDVMEDDSGNEYILSEDEDGKMTKVVLPDTLQTGANE